MIPIRPVAWRKNGIFNRAEVFYRRLFRLRFRFHWSERFDVSRHCGCRRRRIYRHLCGIRGCTSLPRTRFYRRHRRIRVFPGVRWVRTDSRSPYPSLGHCSSSCRRRWPVGSISCCTRSNQAGHRIGRRVFYLSHKTDQNPGIHARMRETEGTRFQPPIETDVLDLGV